MNGLAYYAVLDLSVSCAAPFLTYTMNSCVRNPEVISIDLGRRLYSRI